MFRSAETVERLISLFRKLPGVGPKSAGRLAFHILKMSTNEALELAETIKEVKEKVGFCDICQNISETSPCYICNDPKRDKTKICVVEEAMDVVSLEKVEGYRGLYHVLGGRLSPLDGIGPEDIKIQELLKRLPADVEEIVIATNPTVEGEATAIYIAKLTKPLGVKVTRIARGIPVGADLEFADVVTLTRALEGRREI